MSKHIIVKYDYQAINNYIKYLREENILWSLCCVFVERKFKMSANEAIEAVHKYINKQNGTTTNDILL